MSWLDNIICVPAIGIALKPDFRAVPKIPQLVAPLAEKLDEDGTNPTVTYEQQKVSVSSEKDGFVYRVKPKEITVEFRYLAKEQKKPGSFPYFSEIEVRSYTDLLDEMTTRSIDAIKLFSEDVKFKTNRIGIVAQADTTQEAIPPGISDFLNRMESISIFDFSRLNLDFLSTISEDVKEKKYFERCHHLISFDHDSKPDAINIRLDWQKVFSDWVELTEENIEKLIKDCEKEAQNYFQKFGEGGILNVSD